MNNMMKVGVSAELSCLDCSHWEITLLDCRWTSDLAPGEPRVVVNWLPQSHTSYTCNKPKTTLKIFLPLFFFPSCILTLSCEGVQRIPQQFVIFDVLVVNWHEQMLCELQRPRATPPGLFSPIPATVFFSIFLILNLTSFQLFPLHLIFPVLQFPSPPPHSMFIGHLINSTLQRTQGGFLFQWYTSGFPRLVWILQLRCLLFVQLTVRCTFWHVSHWRDWWRRIAISWWATIWCLIQQVGIDSWSAWSNVEGWSLGPGSTYFCSPPQHIQNPQ